MRTALSVLCLVSFATLLPAQSGHVGRFTGFCTTNVEDSLLNNAFACGPLTTQIASYGAGAGCFAPTPFPFGGHALDQLHDLVYTCDGSSVHVSANPLYAANPCTGPFPGTVFSVPFALNTSGLAFGPVTGMCVGHGAIGLPPFPPCPDLLFVTDGFNVMGFDPRPPYAVFIGPWAMPATLLVGSLLTGLEFDDEDNSIWATDDNGTSYQFTPFGTVLQGPIFAIPGASLGNIVGNIVDRSTCPRQMWVTDGSLLFPVGGSAPVVLNPPLGSLPYGASFSAEPLVLRGSCPSTCNPLAAIGTSEPVASGMSALKSLSFTLTGAPPTTFALLAFDFTCAPPTFFPPTCLWWLNTSFSWFYQFTGTTTPGGSLATPGLLLPPAACPGLCGLTGYAQWFYIDGCASSGLSVTDALHLRLSSL